MIDLHIHSTYSDGSLTPEEIINYSKAQGLKAISITDHDTIDGVREALQICPIDLEIIPGIELGVGRDRFHLLGLFIDLTSRDLREALREIARQRMNETIKLFRSLKAKGVNLRPDDLLKAGKELNTRNVALLMIEMGYARTKLEAYAKYLEIGESGGLTRYTLSPEEKIEIIKKANGLAILAHPFQVHADQKELEKTIAGLKAQGLDGIEAYHSSGNWETEQCLLTMAERYELLITGGSDYHGELKPGIEIGKISDNRQIPYSILQRLKDKNWSIEDQNTEV